MKHPIIISLDARHLATILGSLRATQAVQQSEPLAPEIQDIMTDGGTLAALDDGEVDALCERLNAGGLTFGEAVNHYGAVQDADEPDLAAYRAAVPTREGELEVDPNAIVSVSDDGGAYVAAWVWVTDDQAGIETEEDEPGTITEEEAQAFAANLASEG